MKSQTLLVAAAIGLAPATELNAVVTISRQPTNQWVSLGAHVTNSVTATSTATPITYQWYGKGVLLPDQTNRTCILKNIQLDQAGEYYVVVNDADNQPVQSNPANVTVDPTFVKITEDPVVTESANSEHASWWDPDGDGWLDLFVCHTAGPGPGVLPSFFQNDRDGTFTQSATNAIAQARKRSLGSMVGDFDNDGDEDIYYSGNAHPGSTEPRCDLFRNDGEGQFTRITGPWQQDLDLTCDSVFVDYDQDGLLDIYVVNGHKQPACLYRQTPQGAFVKMTAAQVGSILSNAPESWNAAWADYDNDGDLDMWMQNYEGPSQLHLNDGRGFFTQVTEGSIVQGITGGVGFWGDYDNDGWLDLFAGGDGSGGPYTNALHRNLEGVGFTNVATSAGVALKMACWSAAWGDYDNDGWLDLFASVFYYPGVSGTNVFFHNRGDGTFAQLDVGSPIRDGKDHIFVSWADYDNDGFLDLFLGCGEPEEPDHLYRNNARAIGNANHWLKIKLNGHASNRSGIGAKIRVKANIDGREMWQIREITGNGHSAGGPGLIAHFGLGDATQAEVVRVEWPSGNLQELTDVAADQLRTITEAVGITPVRPSASLGGSVTLTAQLTGTWQWYHDGVALDGQTGQTLTLSNITTNEAGRYSVVVDSGSATFTNYVYLLLDTQFERIPMGSTAPSWGCAWGDYNNDDYSDLFVAEGTTVSAAPSSLYRNLKDGSLVKVAAEEAGDIVSLARHWWCPAWGDYDNDGYLDLFVTDGSETSTPLAVLWRNLGDGRFVEATEAGSFASDWLWTVPMWGDFNRDGHLDLFVANAYYQPPKWNVSNALYLSLGNGTFRKKTEGEIVTFRGQLQGGSAGDMDGDGDLDILLTGPEGATLFENDGAAGFHQIGFPAVSGLCITPSWADYDNDGRLDVFVAAYSQTSQLLHNDGNGQWTAIPLGPALQTSAGSWADYDNDGDLDLFITRGQATTTTNLLYANNGDGTFTQVTLGSLANDPGNWAGCAWADYDNNGFQDLFVTGHAGTSEVLYRNHGNGNHWVSFKLVGTRSNRSAIGAKVRVQAAIFGKTYWQMREIGGGNRHQNDLRPHFGLGDALRATSVRVEWPSGTIEEFANLPRDQYYTIVEPSMRGALKANGEFELSVWASTNRTCTIEHSPDLLNWTVLTTVTGQGETPVTVTDPGAPAQDHRFYRMR